MKLDELLTELRQNVLGDRSDRISGTPDYLWSDETLTRYINDAQRRFARRSLILRDSNYQEVTLVADQAEYTLDPLVIAVISAKHGEDDGGQDLWRVGHSIFQIERGTDFAYWDPNSVAQANPGKPGSFSTDETLIADDDVTVRQVVMRVYPKPSTAYDQKILYLRVVRLPVKLSSSSQSCELPEDYQQEMLSWAAHLAFLVPDRDTFNTDLATLHLNKFNDAVKSARLETMRKFQSPSGFGFGRSGWAYSR
jgi:hypothetical protein